jgi:hypothetical protein
MLSILEFITKKSESDQVKANDAEIFLPTVFVLLNNDNVLLKSKANILFDMFMAASLSHRFLLFYKKIGTRSMD